MTYLREVLDVSPADVEAMYALALLEDEAGQVAEARELYEQVIQKLPEWPQALHSLGWSYSMQAPTDYRRGIDLLTKASELVPTDGTHWYALGTALEAAGEGQSAFLAFEKAVKTDVRGYVVEAAADHIKELKKRLHPVSRTAKDRLIEAGDLRPGLTIELDGNLYSVVDWEHSKTGRDVRLKLRDLRAGHTIERTLPEGSKLTRARDERQRD